MNIEVVGEFELTTNNGRPSFEEIVEKNDLTVLVLDRGENSKYAEFDRFRASIKGDEIHGGVGATQDIAIRNLGRNIAGKSVSVNNGSIDELKTVKF